MGVLLRVSDAPTSPRKAARHVLANGVVRLVLPPLKRQVSGVGRPGDVTSVYGLDTPVATRAASHAVDTIGRTGPARVARPFVLVATLGLQTPLAREVRARGTAPSTGPPHRVSRTPDRGLTRVQEGVGRAPIGGRALKGAITDPARLGPAPHRPTGALLRNAHQATAAADGQAEVAHPRGKAIGTPDRAEDLAGPLGQDDEVPIPVVVEGERLNRQLRGADTPLPPSATAPDTRATQLGRVAPAEVAHGLLLTKVQEEQVPVAVDALPEKPSQAWPR